MGPRIKDVHEKSYRVVAHPGLIALYEALADAQAGSEGVVQVEITIKGSNTITVNLNTDNFPEMLEILRLTIGED